jgi:hypothetical protein
VQSLLDRFHITASDVPVLICRGEVVLHNPRNAAIAQCPGLNEALDASQIHDLIIIGADPAGLAETMSRCLIRRIEEHPAITVTRERRSQRWKATGDVRASNIKRVASDVGEDSIAVSFVQHVLTE